VDAATLAEFDLLAIDLEDGLGGLARLQELAAASFGRDEFNPLDEVSAVHRMSTTAYDNFCAFGASLHLREMLIAKFAPEVLAKVLHRLPATAKGARHAVKHLHRTATNLALVDLHPAHGHSVSSFLRIARLRRHDEATS